MARHELIDDYLIQLADHMSWRGDRDDISAEVGDHLHSAVERCEAAGLDPTEAQRETLARFGDPDLVAKSFATTSKGGVAVPTRFTVQAGTISLVAAALWAVAFVGWAIGARIEQTSGEWNGGAQIFWMLGVVALISAVALSGVVMLALRERLGGLGLMGNVSLLLMALGGVACLAAWLIMGWGVLIAAGTALFGVAMLRVDVAPRLPAAAFGGAWTLGVLTWVGIRVAEVGTADEWGDYAAALWGFVIVGTTIFALGLVGLGRWLQAEQPADIAPAEPFATV
jgi:hypothetical protein